MTVRDLGPLLEATARRPWRVAHDRGYAPGAVLLVADGGGREVRAVVRRSSPAGAGPRCLWNLWLVPAG